MDVRAEPPRSFLTSRRMLRHQTDNLRSRSAYHPDGADSDFRLWRMRASPKPRESRSSSGNVGHEIEE